MQFQTCIEIWVLFSLLAFIASMHGAGFVSIPALALQYFTMLCRCPSIGQVTKRTGTLAVSTFVQSLFKYIRTAPMLLATHLIEERIVALLPIHYLLWLVQRQWQ